MTHWRIRSRCLTHLASHSERDSECHSDVRSVAHRDGADSAALRCVAVHVTSVST